MVSKIKLAVLISGRGSNLQALIAACADLSFPAAVAVVVSNTAEAPGLALAAAAGLPALICDHTYFKGDKAGFENALASTLEQYGVQLVCLAGFMRVLSPVFLNRFRDKVINIHPSLLPLHKGLDTHARVLAAGDTLHGCSVHLVTPGLDEGPVIAQRTVPVLPGDSPDVLAARVLAQEHILYPQVVRDIATGAVVVRDGRIERTQPLRHHSGQSGESRDTPLFAMGSADRPSNPPMAQASVSRAHRRRAAAVMLAVLAGGVIAVTLVLCALFAA